MSHGKVASVAVTLSCCFAMNANAQGFSGNATPELAPVYTAAEFGGASPMASTGFVKFLQDDSSADNPSDAGSSPSDRAAKPKLPNAALPRSSKDESDATKVNQPTVAKPPISLDDLVVPSIAEDEIGTGDVPDDLAADSLPPSMPLPLAADRGIYSTYHKNWVAMGFCHQPLYFEDAMLERHGHERFPMLQPLVSGAKFFTTIPLAPYQWTLQPPLEDRSTLGSYRAGTPAPVLRQRLPYDKRAIRNQIGASAAAAVAIP